MSEVSEAMAELLEIMRQLRDPARGCPWDKQQTFATIVPFTIEEAYEVADAVDRNDMAGLRDELGDLLLQVVFHSQMASEIGAFGFGEVVRSIAAKMRRRHPHVFGDERMEDAESHSVAWEEHKRQERLQAGLDDVSAVAGVARGLPEWQRAVKLQKKAAAVGFDWPGPAQVIEKLYEEAEEVRAEFAERQALPNDAAVQERLESEMGDLLFVCANLARHAKVDVGNALRRANAKFERRFRGMEALAATDGLKLSSLGLAEQEAYWLRVKLAE